MSGFDVSDLSVLADSLGDDAFASLGGSIKQLKQQEHTKREVYDHGLDLSELADLEQYVNTSTLDASVSDIDSIVRMLDNDEEEVMLETTLSQQLSSDLRVSANIAPFSNRKFANQNYANDSDPMVSLEELENVKSTRGISQSVPEVYPSTEEKRKKFIRVKSMSGRPEEIYHTIRKRNAKTQETQTIQVSHYVLANLLGRGAFGKVYQAMDQNSGQFYAVKRMKISKCDSDAIEREIGFLKKFKHPNIVGYIESVRTDNHINVVLEYVDQKSLSNILVKFGVFPEKLAAIYIAQVLDGLMYLHQNNVVHLDIKAANILINTEGVVKLADFGIATTATQSNNSKRMSIVSCSPYWTSPEVIRNQSENGVVPVTSAADIWSLACTIIELVTGYPPYHDLQGIQAVFKMAEEIPPLPDDVSEELLDFLKACFQVEPTTRPTAAQLRRMKWIRMHTNEPDIPETPSETRATAVTVTPEKAKRLTLINTLTKEQGVNVQQMLASQGWEEEEEEQAKEKEVQEEHPFVPATPSKVRAGSEAQEEKKKKKGSSKFHSLTPSLKKPSGHKKKPSMGGGGGGFDDTISSSSKGSSRRETRSKVAKGASQVKELPNADIMLHISGHENRRHLFAYTVFYIAVSKKSSTYHIERTYTMFRELYDKLLKEFAQQKTHVKVPPCPPKRFWGQMDPDFISKRTQDLQVFLNELVQIPQVIASSPFSAFIAPEAQLKN